MGDTEVKADAIQASSMGELVQDIIDNQYAIGYASFGVANQNEGKVTPLKVNGVAATKENILDGSYIIKRKLLLVGSGDTTDVPPTYLDYVLGDEGHKTVEDMGFFPMIYSSDIEGVCIDTRLFLAICRWLIPVINFDLY